MANKANSLSHTKWLSNNIIKWYNLNTKDVDGFFVLWLEKLMQLEEKEN